MAKFHGAIGYGHSIEVNPGVYDDEITERVYSGEVIRNTRQLINGVKINDDLSVGNSISVLADAYANDNIFAIRYVEWMGALWKVDDVQVQRPRLILRLGGVYNGPRPEAYSATDNA